MHNIKTIKISDKNYPLSLKKIPFAPKVIYVKGKISSNENCFAIVGTRLCSPYGKQIALEIANHLTNAGLTIVSGLAYGIDTWAHKAAIQAKKRTIAVLGTGLQDKSIYPQENLDLSKQIINYGGCLISEFPPETPGYKSNFPARNRIISGLCLGVLVVEAKQKSGALITANWAKKQNKKLFAIPGPIHSQNSKGPHYLIKNGAILVESANDILKALNQKNLKLFVSASEADTKIPEENLILQVLKEKPLHIEKIIEKTNLPAQKVCSMLSIMEINNIITNLGGNIYAPKY